MKIVPWRHFLWLAGLVLVACGMEPARVRPDPRVQTHGMFGADGEWKVRDAVAVRDGDGMILSFAHLWFDRDVWLRDAELTPEGLGAFVGNEYDYAPTLDLRLDKDGRPLAHRLRYGSYGAKWKDALEANASVALSVHQSDRIAGTVRLRAASLRAAIDFDLPVLVFGPIARPGVALPADGGKPGQLLLAKSRAIHEGDLDRLLQLMSPAERRDAIGHYDSDLEFHPGDLEYSGSGFFMWKQRMDMPDIRRIEGGSIEDDIAWVDFSGVDGSGFGDPVVGTAVMIRRRSGWEVREIIVRETEILDVDEDLP